MMFTPHAAAGHSIGSWDERDSYGYGWYLTRVSGMSMCYHSGHKSGFNSFSASLPAPRLSLCILTNDDSAGPQSVARTLLAENQRLLAPWGD